MSQKWVKNEYIYEVASLKSSALLKLESYWAFWRPGGLPGGVAGPAFWVCRAVGGIGGWAISWCFLISYVLKSYIVRLPVR